MEEAVSEIPATARALNRMIHDNRHVWPVEIEAKAERALAALRSMDQPNYARSEFMQATAKRDLQAFAEAYAALRKG